MLDDVQQYYHLSCPKCKNTWWMSDAFPKYCPYCGDYRLINKKKQLNIDIKISKKDCSTCKYGKYNDRYNTTFCYYHGRTDCEDWDKWEAKDS